MAGSGDRFYQLEFRHRPVLHGDVGSMLKIDGLVVGGGGARAILLLPSAQALQGDTRVEHLTDEQWSDWLQRSDDPEILVPNPDGSASLPKIFQRKVRWEVSGAVQQRVWARDNFACMYCGIKMGSAVLSIDHWLSLEMGGKNDPSNYLSSCRKDNKDKAAMHPRDWCKLKGLDYDFFVGYLAKF
jgi:hypothetical protein